MLLLAPSLALAAEPESVSPPPIIVPADEETPPPLPPENTPQPHPLKAPAAAAPEKPVEAAKPEEGPSAYNTIVLQGLNKVTGTISTLSGPVGDSMRFGNLEIVPLRCWKSAPEDQPENAGLLQISELTPGEAPKQIFLGWMFSSSPGLSALEHPVYDITVMSCEATESPEDNKPTLPPEPAPAKLKKKAKKAE